MTKKLRTDNTSSLVGGRATQATDFWDRVLSVEEVSLLLGLRITVLKNAVRNGDLVHGLPAPKPCALSDSSKMFFDGEAIKPLFDAKQA